MRHVQAVLVFIFVSLWAFGAVAYEAEKVPLTFEHEQVVLDAFEYDTGWWPSSGMVQTGFNVVVNGNLAVEMDGVANLAWPEPFTLSLSAKPQDGTLTAGYGVDVAARIKLDLFGMYEGEFDVPYSPGMLQFEQTRVFAPFVLPGATERPVEITVSGDKVQLFDTGFDVLSGVSVNFRADLTGDMVCTFAGVRIDLGNDLALDAAGEGVSVPQEAGYLSTHALDYLGESTCSLQLTIIPAIEVCAPVVDCVELPAVEIPIQTAENGGEMVFETVNVEHKIPGIAVNQGALAFGEVKVGDEASLDLPIQSVGEALLNLEYVLEPEGAPFELFPGDQAIPVDGEGGISVRYAPTKVGTHEATLRILSSDPYTPELVVSITGAGVAEDVPAEDVVEQDSVDEDSIGEDMGESNEDVTGNGDSMGDDTQGSDAVAPDQDSGKASSSGCSVSGGSHPGASFALFLLLVAFLVSTRRYLNRNTRLWQ